MVTPALRFGYLIPLAAACGWVALAMTVFQGQAFGWPAGSPLSAATLAAGYLAAVVALAVASELRRWVDVRAVAITSTVLLGLSLGVMWFHRKEIAAGWMLAHAAALLAGLVLLVVQWRAGHERTARWREPWWTTVRLASLALIGTVLGLALLIAPQRMSPYWPWEATLLDLRMMGAWILSLGVGGWISVAEAAPERRRAGAAGCMVVAISAMLALKIYPGELRGSGLSGRCYYCALFALAAEGTIAWAIARRFHRL